MVYNYSLLSHRLTWAPYLSMTSLHPDQRQIGKMPSASDLCSAGNFASPLAQLSLTGPSVSFTLA